MNFKSIRFKALFFMFLSLTLFFAIVNLFVSEIIKVQFQKLENQKVEENLARVVDAYKSIIENTNVKLSDWSTWDDTYQFITDKNKEYSKSNLTKITAENLKLHFMIFVNNAGEIVAQNGDEVPDDLKKYISERSLLVTDDVNSPKTGVLNLKSGILMFASRPIVTSEGKGPIRGSLLFGSYLNRKEIDNLSRMVHMPIEVVSASEQVSSPTESTIFGNITVNDFFGTPVFQFKIAYTRDITKQGVKTINYFQLIFLISGAFFLIMLFFYLDRILIGRIFKLSVEVEKIGQTKTSGLSELSYQGTDEISLLAKNINTSVTRLQEEENRFSVFMNNLPNVAWIKDSEEWKYTYVNKAWEVTFKKTLQEVRGKTDLSIWSEEIVRNIKIHDTEVLKSNKPIQTYEDVPLLDGTIRHWFVYKFPLTLNGRHQVAGLATDITELKKIEQELTKKTSELEKTNLLMVGREMKMIALKEEIEKLKINSKL